MKNETMIQVIDATACHGQYGLLDHVSVGFEAGKIHGITGDNRSGKNKLAECICGQLALSSGCILVEGKEIGIDIERPENMGVLLRTPFFVPQFSGIENLVLLMGQKTGCSLDDLMNGMKKIGLAPEDTSPVASYSWGERQLLALVPFIIFPPKLLILGETMNGLGNASRKRLAVIFREMTAEGTTIIHAGHHARNMESFCDSITYMKDGKVVTQISSRCSGHSPCPYSSMRHSQYDIF